MTKFRAPNRQIAIISGWVGHRPPEVDAVIKNHEMFSRRHGYQYIHFNEDDIPAVTNLVQNKGDVHWIKPDLIRRSLSSFDYVFWTDLDSVFHRIDRSLTDLVKSNKELIFTGDKNDLCNAGHLFFKRSQWSLDFIDQWSSLRHVKFPKLHTTLQGPSGYVGDQIALNYLLAGGEIGQGEVDASAQKLFNRTNGWEGNPESELADFSERHAPTSSRNLARSTELVSPILRKHVRVVVQHRLNAYPWWGPKKKNHKRGPIIHFVSPYKNYLASYLENHSF